MHRRVFLGSPARLADGHYEFLISVPIGDGTTPDGVLVATVRINDFWHAIRAAVEPHNSMIYLIDSRGSLLNQPEGSQHTQGDLLSNHEVVRTLLAGKNWTKQQSYRGFEGSEVFAIASLISGPQWGIISEIPAQSLLDPIVDALITLVLIVLFLHVAFGLVSLLFTRRLLSPITELAEMTHHAAAGDYDFKARSSNFREIDQLTQAFNRMIDRIAQREQALQQAQQAIDHAGEAVIVTNREGHIEYVNPAFCRMTGYSKEEAIGHTPGSLINSGTQPKSFYQEMWQRILSGARWSGTLTNRRKDGSEIPVQMSLAPVFDGSGAITHFVAIQRDLSEQRLLEAQLLQAQKMESIGTLAGGIAHDFNNMIAGINGHIHLVRRKADAHPEIARHLDAIAEICDHSATLIAQLLTFARKGETAMQRLSLNDLLSGLLKISNVAIPKNIRFRQELPEQPLVIRGNATQLQQVLINLLNNARDAVEHVGEPSITLRLEPFTADTRFHHEHPELGGEQFARITVQDNGHGIPPEALDQVFDPFYTTKEAGKGTGLGLAMCYGAIHDHHGTILVDSTPDKGTCFTIYLPLAEGEAASRVKETDKTTNRDAQGARILLADDDARVREPLAEVLGDLGFHVVPAADGREALAVFDAAGDTPFAIAVLDVVMPELDGPGLALELRRRDPELPILFVTGYDRAQVLQRSPITESVEVITKPYRVETLIERIHQLLRRKED